MVEYINYQKKRYPIRISYYALKRVQQEFKVSLEKITESGDMGVYEALLFHGLTKGAQVTGEPMKFTREQIEDVMDEVFFEFMELMPKFFPNYTKEKGKLGESNPVKPGKGKS